MTDTPTTAAGAGRAETSLTVAFKHRAAFMEGYETGLAQGAAAERERSSELFRGLREAARAWANTTAVCSCEDTPEGRALLDAIEDAGDAATLDDEAKQYADLDWRKEFKPMTDQAVEALTAARGPFFLDRDADASGVSGIGRVAQGFIFEDGTVALRWLTEHRSTAIYSSIGEVEAIHGHNGSTHITLAAAGYAIVPADRSEGLRAALGRIMPDGCAFDPHARCAIRYPEEPDYWCNGCTARAAIAAAYKEQE